MSEEKARFSIKHLVYIVPALFALLFGAIILLPISFAIMFIMQAQLVPQSILVCVMVVAVGLDYLTLAKLKGSAIPASKRTRWKAAIILIPFVGSLSFLLLKPDQSPFKTMPDGSEV